MPFPLLLPMPSSLVVLGALRPAPGPARSWVERELSRPEYQQSLLARLFAWVGEQWADLQNAALGASGLSTGAAIVVLVVLVAVAVLIASRVRHDPGRALDLDAVLVPGQTSPQEHRAAAESAWTDGAFDLAIVEAFRALATRSVQRGLVEDRPGLTAHELVDALRPLFPGHDAPLTRSSLLFDLVFYGDQPASARDARSVLDLDEALRQERPARPADGPRTAVPQ